jgi:hypothetical protein
LFGLKGTKLALVLVGIGVAAGIGISFAFVQGTGPDVYQRAVEDDGNPWLDSLFLKSYQDNLRTGVHYKSQLTVGEEGFYNSSAKGGKLPYQYEWKFSDGAVFASQNITHSFDTPGKYDIHLTITDAGGQKKISDIHTNVVPGPTTTGIENNQTSPTK